ncbi:hypothetical protein RQP46_007181 [Phenoliferia psychrophenolica]
MEDSTIASSAYARERRDLVGLINRIRSSGAQLVVDLPRIAVIGKQSAGKSSLIESISAIKVPRDSVSLRFESDSAGRPLANIKETLFGPTLTDPNKVEDTLKRAQLAILNPSIDSGKFVNGTPATGTNAKQLEFSTNIIVVDISGPEVTDLAFVDLPGLISNGSQELIDLVRNLVVKYIKGNCLILVALTVGDDLENQSAAHLAREQDPSGDRTIGVLTKADRLPKGEEETWIRILRNQRVGSVLRHGYYSTKLSNAEELLANPSFAAARQAEEQYFSETKPWSTLEVEHKSRLGTKKLTDALSQLLQQYIREKLPGLVAEVNQSLAEVRNQIRALPAPPSADASFELIQLATRFTTTIERFAAGSAAHKSLVQGATQQYQAFKKEILTTVPYFVPFEKSSKDSRKDSYVEPSFLETEGVTAAATKAAGADARLRMDLDDVKTIIKEAVTRELPFCVPFDAKKSVILLAIQSWKELALECLNEIRPLVVDAVTQTVEDHFGRYSQGPLRGAVLALAIEEVEKLYHDSRESIEWLARLNETPFTQNTHYLSATREKVLAHYLSLRRNWNGESQYGAFMDQALASLAQIGLPASKETLPKLFSDDEYLEELIVMAETRAYFQIAYKRVIDDVPLAIDCDLIRPLGEHMLEALLRGLGVNSEGGAAKASAWLSESPTVTMERKELSRKKESLETARRELRSFGV